MTKLIERWGGMIRNASIIVATLFATYNWGLPYLAKATDQLLASQNPMCVQMPPDGFVTNDEAPIGGSGIVNWKGVKRLREGCGKPELSATLYNGNRVLHSAPLMFNGLDLPVGEHDLSYPFGVTPLATEGICQLKVDVTFPHADPPSPPASTPWVPFRCYIPPE